MKWHTLMKHGLSAMVLALVPFPVPANAAAPVAGNVSYARLRKAEDEPGQWLTGGRDLSGSYYSPLRQINDKNVKELGFAWDYDLGTNRGLEATPLVVDGVMYTSGNWGRVYALDATVGKELWTFDPKPDGQSGRTPCCDVVNRGVAVWRGKVYVASIDGRLFALDAKTGRQIWVADTITDHERPYAVTGAPQIAHHVVVIGNSGADFGVRGYVSAYDLDTGKLKWRFYTVPANPKSGFKQPEMKMAAKTWPANSDWKSGLGGTAWDSMAYDPSVNLLYVGTGNSSPYNPKKRSPGGGDNLFLASILAIDPDTGRLKWYYQEVPGESWDYTATQKMILTDLRIDGKVHKVLMQAPKDGFFYVLDRETGRLLAASNYTFVNWASGINMKTGRPIRTAQSDYNTGPKMIYPSMAGGHDWQPMSYNPHTGLVYIPVIDMPMIYIDLVGNHAPVEWVDGMMDVGAIEPDSSYKPQDYEPFFGKLPTYAEINKVRAHPRPRGYIKAWDPVTHEVVWQHETSSFWDGGTMTTAGNLVFQGRDTGVLWVYAADTGKVLAKIPTGSSIMAAPMTYEIRGIQYVALMAGFGGGFLGTPYPTDSAAYRYGNEGRIVVFKLGGGPVPIPPRIQEASWIEPTAGHPGTKAQIDRGARLYVAHCSRCHALAPGILPDLRRVGDTLSLADCKNIVLEGALVPMGMGRFDDILDDADVDALYDFFVDQAWAAYDEQEAAKKSSKQSP